MWCKKSHRSHRVIHNRFESENDFGFHSLYLFRFVLRHFANSGVVALRFISRTCHVKPILIAHVCVLTFVCTRRNKMINTCASAYCVHKIRNFQSFFPALSVLLIVTRDACCHRQYMRIYCNSFLLSAQCSYRKPYDKKHTKNYYNYVCHRKWCSYICTFFAGIDLRQASVCDVNAKHAHELRKHRRCNVCVSRC